MSTSRTSKRTSKRVDALRRDIREWSARLVALREEVGFDLSHPTGFSKYLLAVYAKGADPGLIEATEPPFKHAGHGQREWSKSYSEIFRAWFRAMAPNGMVAARGMHSISFLPGDDVARMIYGGRREDYTSYTMNLPVATYEFSASYLPPKKWLSLSSWGAEPLWARAIDAVAGSSLVQEVQRRGMRFGLDDLPPKLRQVARDVACALVVVSHLSEDDIKSWGGDSESGDTNEAELHVKHCEPECAKHIFVASKMKLGRPVSDAKRRLYALDEHRAVPARKVSSLDRAYNLRIHPEVDHPGKIVRHLPDGWDWYEVPKE